ncbi:MAG: hypothetical protein PHU25_17155 [Deltaproteobacteria bacterium]|nr:hypothetical protein [Deltaproteobacteria bacterium]
MAAKQPGPPCDPAGDTEWVDVALRAVELRLGIELIAVDADDPDECLYGMDTLDRVADADDPDPATLMPLEEVGLTVAQWAELAAIEGRLAIRIVAYDRRADAVVYGGDVVDDAVARCGGG